MNKNTKKIIVGILVLVIIGAAFLLIYKNFAPQASAGEKDITVTVVHKDGTSKAFDYSTDAEYLGEVIKEEALVEGEEGAYGLYIKTVDGETVNDKEQEWWCLTKAGGQVNTSADQTPIDDGDKFEFTFTIGY